MKSSARPCQQDGKPAHSTFPTCFPASLALALFPEFLSLTGFGLLNSLTYTWLENGRPAKIPAPSYIVRVQKWIVGKIHDESVFPTAPPPSTSIAATAYMSGDTSSGTVTPTSATGVAAAGLGSPTLAQGSSAIPAGPTTVNQSLASLAGLTNDWVGRASGFPQHFHADVKSIVKQMFRCYAHLYHNHYDDFWHMGRHLELNSCFVHFMTVSMYYDLLPRKDIEPLQGLVDIFVSQGVIPREAVAQHNS